MSLTDEAMVNFSKPVSLFWKKNSLYVFEKSIPDCLEDIVSLVWNSIPTDFPTACTYLWSLNGISKTKPLTWFPSFRNKWSKRVNGSSLFWTLAIILFSLVTCFLATVQFSILHRQFISMYSALTIFELTRQKYTEL